MDETCPFDSGDQFVLPWDKEFFGKTFTVMETRPLLHGLILDAICDDDESVVISINASEVERI